ncbi:hypothetical protein Tdes44962_MAKER04386 [Teratosphaeria destructans]|uniref:Uncharacterized protein n=1 Tax=Teratosphaeria destructans TaxID=418781 RepID=A0A9W7W010_9PEZI|nr:hypothetical protein Tdes44962_MAKER04386 [Teratosphaeria destructans]
MVSSTALYGALETTVPGSSLQAMDYPSPQAKLASPGSGYCQHAKRLLLRGSVLLFSCQGFAQAGGRLQAFDVSHEKM